MRLTTMIAISVSLLFLTMGCDSSPAAPDSMNGDGGPAPATSLAPTTLATSGASSQRGGGPLARPLVYVINQGLIFDSIVTADPLPMRGRFQKLEPGGPVGLQTDFGPGDPGYLGGRWWMDTTAPFGEMNEGDHFFMCPLQGPGREP